MNLFLVSIRYGTEEWDQYIPARTEEEAIRIAKNTLPGRVKRWASVFVG